MLEIEDRLAAYLFDSAVDTVGVIIENALYERDEVGTGKDKRSEPRYTAEQILAKDFTLPHPARKRGPARGTVRLKDKLRSVFGAGLRVFKEQEHAAGMADNAD